MSLGGGCALPQRPMRAGIVVVGPEPVQLGLELLYSLGPWLFGLPTFQGLVGALHLAAGLGVVGAGVLVGDP